MLLRRMFASLGVLEECRVAPDALRAISGEPLLPGAMSEAGLAVGIKKIATFSRYIGG